jgi:hypothetical protein
MTKEELQETLLYIVYKAYGKDSDIADSVEQLLTITEQYYREAGWKSPEEEITCPDCGIKYKLKEFIW